MIKMRIKKGDTVKVLSGKDKGKVGKVLEVHPQTRRVVVENVNIHTKFEKGRKAGEASKRITTPSGIAVSKVMLVDGSSGQPTRVGYQILESGAKQRIAKASGKAV